MKKTDTTLVGLGVSPAGKGWRAALSWKNISASAIERLGLSSADRVILLLEEEDHYKDLRSIIDTMSPPPPVIDLVLPARREVKSDKPGVIDLGGLLAVQVETEWRRLEAGRRVIRLRQAMEGRKRVILTQNDPDPDAIGSGLALQALLGQGSNDPPICTFGEVTRSENISMIRLLGVEITTITPDDVAKFDAIAMVDVQPPYFADISLDMVDAVIDHHPYPSTYPVRYRHVDPTCGSTSTIMYEYLEAAGIAVDERVATGLLYGLITDTMNLSRETTERDFKVFSALWPRASHQALAAMSRPHLQREELLFFADAILNHSVIGPMNFVWLGEVTSGDIIPRVADFALQFGNGVWSAVAGIHGDDLVISFRYAGQSKNAGELAAALFGDMGSAGGHRSMAKGVVPLATFREATGAVSSPQIREAVADLFATYFSEQ